MPWMLRSCRVTLLESFALMPTDAQLPYGAVERLHASGLLPPRCEAMQELWSVMLRQAIVTLLLPASEMMLLARSLPQSSGGAEQPWSQPLPTMRVGFSSVPLGTLAMKQSHDQLWLQAG